MNIERIQKASGMVGRSDAIHKVLDMVAQVAPVDISVLVTGESGTGKELVAKALHQNSKRAQNPLVTVNCGAIPEGIIESELFGHKKGAYTDARGDRKGYFESANKGTIFLDEIGETPLETQVKLLRVLESGEFTPVGASTSKKTDVRVVAATNKDLSELVENGKFRQDLFYRLKTVTIEVPALRHRVEDISLLVERFALEFTRSNDIVYRGFIPEAIRTMKTNPWKGNIRELKNFVESIIVLEKGERITVEMVERNLGNIKKESTQNPALPMLMNQPPEAAERELILRQLFLLRQDVEFLKQFATQGSVVTDQMNVPIIGQEANALTPSLHIDSESEYFIQNNSIGDMSLEDLEREAIERTLKFFRNNRRATAKSLGMSERTLYRKIDQYGLERKIKV
ncbi:MAG: sigma-54-dependent Fis family transcriptional regulator [Candidatus Marinimicrobia bacterium]|jgi:DNA-binding NtrC family response regulator|nr:sigma-54-dependent Fis family transcriptional regulator [Candidatus Neomarinimicrobiota bacterium]MBT4065573.1 sigma-54-dependent Fis family transcriptional regulator [Candidatus Neomarinimicrobiota bacterium]MBT4308640.1 sigma-54-dependent Fis family transcriptional regulator [Candidatus Neomarinimicrobiota bacterium]MBT4453728.1 sigma-54-dependent Fis family transcriptional regulator [Candidatus Neomarinimicrobiota bacterium]MBT4735720.1 sigma-54-dependent Fis family transcriptional regula